MSGISALSITENIVPAIRGENLATTKIQKIEKIKNFPCSKMALHSKKQLENIEKYSLDMKNLNLNHSLKKKIFRSVRKNRRKIAQSLDVEPGENTIFLDKVNQSLARINQF
jgi:hypothetical protein